MSVFVYENRTITYRELNHSHPSGTETPSGLKDIKVNGIKYLAGTWGDAGFAKKIKSTFPGQDILFNIFTPYNENKYHNYNYVIKI